MKLLFFLFIFQLYIKYSIEEDLIPCETSIPNKNLENNNLDNIIFLFDRGNDNTYNSFSYMLDSETGNCYIQNEDYYFDKRTICEFDKYGQIIMNKTIIAATSIYGGENIIMNINNNKYILCLNNFESNLINLNTLQIESLSKNYIEEINSYSNTLININRINSQNNLLFGFVSQSELLLYFYTFSESSLLNPDTKFKAFKTIPFLKMISCFQTNKLYIECLYINYLYQSEVLIFNENFDFLGNIILNQNLIDIENNYFNKAILYKNEVGIYLYCYQYLEIKELSYDKYYGKYILKNYNDIIINDTDILRHNKYVNKMDLVKLALNNFAVIELSELNEDNIYITIFTLYNNDKYLKIRMFEIDISIFDIKPNDIMKGFNFNNLLGIGFNGKNYSTSFFIIFGYCNSTLQNLYTIKPDFELKPSDYININNNIFSDILYGYKIISLPDDNSGIHLASKLTQNKIFINDILPINDSIIFGFNQGNIINSQYKIEFVPISSQNPDLDIIQKNSIFTKYYGKEDINSFFKPEKFLGKLTHFNFQFQNPINSFQCDSNSCNSCLYSNPIKCLTCSNQLNKIAENTNICYDNIPDNNYYYDEIKLMYMKCHINCNKCSQGPIYKENTFDDLISSNCIECKNNNFYEKEYNGYKNCIINKCPNLFYLFDNEIKCVNNTNNKCPKDYPYLNILTNECLITCGNLNTNICIDTYKIKLSFEEYLNEVRNLIKNGTIYRILNESNTGSFYFIEDNITYQVTMTNNEKDNISTTKIDLGECENLLKDIYDIDDDKELIILKIDIYEANILFPKIQYELYHPDTRILLNLSICDNLKLDIEYEVEIDESELYIYDPTSDYYTDICNTTTSEAGTDITLSDRKEEFLKKNLSICDKNCKFVGYNTETKQVKCECDILTEIRKNLGELKKMNFGDIFIGLQNSLNFKVMSCHKLFFSEIGFATNMGSYIMLAIILLFIGCVVYFFLKDLDNIKGIIDDILAYKRIKNFEKEEKLITEIKNNRQRRNAITIFKGLISSNEDSKSIKSQNISSDKMIRNKNFKINKKNLNENKHIETQNKEMRYKRRKENKNLDLIQKSTMLSLTKYGNPPKVIKSKNEPELNNKKRHVGFKKPTIYELKKVDKSHKKYKLLKLNDYELNSLSYEFAIKIDERTFLEYYWSLLKRNQLFFFSFFPNIDYNSRSIKLFFFFHSFSVSYTINAIFFNDSTMHKIYEDEGQYYFVRRLPQKLLTSVLTVVIDLIIRNLSLSERNIIKIKRESDMNKTIMLSNKVYKVLKIKFSIFFIFSFLLLIFFWYYLGCFCAVYKNTQLYLFKDTCLSYFLSLLYPFGIYLVIAVCRICSLKCGEKNKTCLYNISKWIG